MSNIASFLVREVLILILFALPTRASDPLPPSEDPWYAAPIGYELARPGEVLRLRPAPGNLTATFNLSSTVYNILYRTTDSNYRPSWAVTSLLVPVNASNKALLSYQIPYNTADVDTSPSYTFHAPTSGLGIVATDIQHMLGLGWHVNVPDFEGPLASAALGVQEGHAVLDSIRAILNTGFGLADDARYAMWGFSGGALASGWAAELQVQYAPELDFAGTALGGLPDNVTAILENDNPQWWSGLIPIGLLGYTSQDAAAREYLLSQLRTSGPYNKTGFLVALHIDVMTAFALFVNQTILTNYFVNGSDVLKAPVIQRILNNNAYMGYHGVPQMPLFIYKAVEDEIAPIPGTDDLVARYCKVGADIVFERNTVGSHLAEETNGDERALQFLERVLTGAYEHEGCTVRDVTVNATGSSGATSTLARRVLWRDEYSGAETLAVSKFGESWTKYSLPFLVRSRATRRGFPSSRLQQ